MTTRTATAVRHRNGVAVIDVRGDVDSRAEHSLDAAWRDAVAERPAAVALNFTDTGYINSTGIALIVGILAAARAQRIPVRAYGLSPHYLEIFEITRLADFLAISPDEDTAVHDDDPDNDPESHPGNHPRNHPGSHPGSHLDNHLDNHRGEHR
jgi:anti-anti-sigma factor